MPVYLLGEGSAQMPPFSRTFFNVTLGDLLDRAGKSEKKRLNLYLTDGLTLVVCKIEQLSDQYMIVRGFRGDEDICDATLHVVPYGLIYRLEIDPRGSEDTRVGFEWAPHEHDDS